MQFLLSFYGLRGYWGGSVYTWTEGDAKCERLNTITRASTKVYLT